jgi:hypothetical protein
MSRLYSTSIYDVAGEVTRELHHEREGWISLYARPGLRNERYQPLWTDLLRALGHNTMSSTKSRATNYAEALALAWLAATPIQHVVVAGANDLLAPHLNRLVCTLTATGVTTWLLYDVAVNDDRLNAHNMLGPTPITPQDFLAARRAAVAPPPLVTREPFPRIGDTHFLTFIDTASAQLDKANADRAINLYRAGRAQMLQRLNARPDTTIDITDAEIGHHLDEITRGVNDLNELVCVIKGAETGAFLGGYYLRVDPRRWLSRGTLDGFHHTLTPDQWAQLARRERPSEAALAALSTLGISIDELPTITADDITADGSTVRHNGTMIPVPQAAQHFLVAQHVFRQLARHETGGFLANGAKEPHVTTSWARSTLNVITRDTAIVMRIANSTTRGRGSMGWKHRLGLTVARIPT